MSDTPRVRALLVSVLALLALTGCSTVGPGDSAVKKLPENTIVIRNHTPYTLRVFRNGVPWNCANVQKGQVYRRFAVQEVMPHQEVVLYNVTSQSRERITLGLDAVKILPPGPPLTNCLGDDEVLIGRHRFRLTLGTHNPPILVTVRGRGF